MVEESIYDVVIIGAGPGGMSAALYLSRSNLKVLMLEKGAPGGQILNTDVIENYIGASSTDAHELASTMYQQSVKFGAEYRYGDVTAINKEGDIFLVETRQDSHKAKTVLVATGTEHRKLGVSGEEEFSGRGVSYCATCDGAFFKDKEIVVVGGGDSALESALYLTQFGNVRLIHRRDSYRAEPYLQEQVKKNDKIVELMDTEIDEINSSDGKSVTSVLLNNHLEGYDVEVDVQGVFINIGQNPQTSFIPKEVATSHSGHIVVNELYETSVEGLYAIGDVIDRDVRQVANAVGDGSMVADYIYKHLNKL